MSDDQDDDVNVLNCEALYTCILHAPPRTVRLRRWKCFSVRKLTLYLDQYALLVSSWRVT